MAVTLASASPIILYLRLIIAVPMQLQCETISFIQFVGWGYAWRQNFV